MVMHGMTGEESYEELGIRILKDIKGKTVKSLAFTDDRMDDFLIIGFTDNTSIRVHYDWIYDIEVTKE